MRERRRRRLDDDEEYEEEEYEKRERKNETRGRTRSERVSRRPRGAFSRVWVLFNTRWGKEESRREEYKEEEDFYALSWQSVVREEERAREKSI